MRRSDRLLFFAALILAVVCGAIAQNEPGSHNTEGDKDNDQGFTDTPMLPGLPWHVHDPARPHPRVVAPGARPGQAPSDAVILFDGKDLLQWSAARLGTAAYTISSEPAPWKVRDGYFEVAPRTGDIASREKFGDAQVHLEWMEPANVQGFSQSRGNSGVFLMGLFEIQVLDSFRSPTYADGQAGAMYGQWPPLVNAVKRPGEWQSYDIVFEAPRYAGEKLARPAYITVFLNGVVVQNHREEMGPTIYRRVPKYVAGPAEGPIVLQDHGSPVRFRNIWVRRLD